MIENILNQLKRVRRTGKDQWVASSPTREDKTPSLAIKLDSNGNILLHDFGGSSTNEILDALGLDFNDLFADGGEKFIGVKSKFNAFTMLQAVKQEVLICSLAALTMGSGKTLAKEDQDRLLLAAERLKEAYELCQN